MEVDHTSAKFMGACMKDLMSRESGISSDSSPTIGLQRSSTESKSSSEIFSISYITSFATNVATGVFRDSGWTLVESDLKAILHKVLSCFVPVSTTS